MTNDCAKCKEFDQVTRDRMRELFGRDEAIICGSSLVSFLLTLMQQKRKLDRNNLKRFHFDSQIAVTSRTLGKFMVMLEPADREAFLIATEKQSGIKLAINDEPCPHQDEEKRDAVQQSGEAESPNGDGTEATDRRPNG